MTIPAITPLPTAPTVTDDRATFNTRAFNLWLAQQGLVTEFNAATAAFAVDAAAAVAAADADAVAAAASATAADADAVAAAASATAADVSAVAAAASATAADVSAVAAADGWAPYKWLKTATLTLAAATGSVPMNCVRVVALDANREMIVFAGNTNVFAVVYDAVSNAFGPPMLVRTANITYKAHLRAILCSTDKVLVCSINGSGTAFQAVVLSVSGTTITVNAAASATLAGNMSAPYGMGPIQAVGTSFVIGYARATTAVGFRAMTVSGTTVTIGAESAETSNTPIYAPIIFGVDATKFLALYWSNTSLLAKPFTVSGSALTPGTASASVTLSSGANLRACYIPSTSRWMVAFTNTSPYAVLASVSGTTASFSATATTGVTSSAQISLSVISGAAKVFVSAGFTNVITDNAGTPVAGTAISTGFTTDTVVRADATSVTVLGMMGVAKFTESAGSPVLAEYRAPGPFNGSSTTYHADTGAGLTDEAKYSDDARSTLCDTILCGPEFATMLNASPTSGHPFVNTARVGGRSEARLSCGVYAWNNGYRVGRLNDSTAWVLSAPASMATVTLEKIQSL